MIQAFYTGLSGLKTNQTAIDITSDNIANASTTGFRSNVAEFSSIFERSIYTASSAVVNSTIGIGASISATSMNNETGSILGSDRSTDLAISGDGWFGIQAFNEPLYTRDGEFTFDVDRDLVTHDGFHVLGTMGNNIANGVLAPPLATTELGNVETQEKLNFPDTLAYPTVPTTQASFFANLGVEDQVIKVSSRVIDSEGNNNHLELVFTMSEVQNPIGTNWDVVATTQDLENETIFDTQAGTLAFDSGGALLLSTLGSINNNGSSVAIDLGSGYAGITAINIPVVTGSSQADGKQGGDLLGYEINTNGEVVAAFTNGEQSSVGRVAVFHFQNDQGLERINGSRFQQSSNSGDPIFYQDENGKNILGATLQNFKLESSNVEYAVALTDLIIYQRSYDANAKSITTADEMMQKALNMDA